MPLDNTRASRFLKKYNNEKEITTPSQYLNTNL